MSSRRCKMLVKEDLEKLGLPHAILAYGVVEIMTDLRPEQLMHLKTNRIRSGWELLDDKRSLLIEKITSPRLLDILTLDKFDPYSVLLPIKANNNF